MFKCQTTNKVENIFLFLYTSAAIYIIDEINNLYIIIKVNTKNYGKTVIRLKTTGIKYYIVDN